MKISFAPKAEEVLKAPAEDERRGFVEAIDASAKDAASRSNVGMIAFTAGRRAIVMMTDGDGGFVLQAISS